MVVSDGEGAPRDLKPTKEERFCVHDKNWAEQMILSGLPQWLRGKDSAWNARDPGLIPGSGRSPGGGHGNPPQHSCLGSPTDRGAPRAVVHGVAKSWTWLKWLSMHTRIGKKNLSFLFTWIIYCTLNYILFMCTIDTQIDWLISKPSLIVPNSAEEKNQLYSPRNNLELQILVVFNQAKMGLNISIISYKFIWCTNAA